MWLQKLNTGSKAYN